MVVVKDNEVLIALYGIMRQGEGGFYNIDNYKVEYVGQYITEPNFDMISISNLYPAIFSNGNTSITLDVYRVKSVLYEDIIDEVFGYSVINQNNNLFNKHIIETPFGHAFIYYYNRRIRKIDKVIESGDWVYHNSAFNINTTKEYEKNIKIST